MTADPPPGKRGIRSYVLRTGRITPSQKSAFDRHWHKYGLNLGDGEFNQQTVFPRKAPLVLEIGFGMGESLCAMAEQEPDKSFIGIEVHTPGVGRLLNDLAVGQIDNVRIYRDDAVAVLQQCVADNSIARLQLYFPDPWPKKKHHKRRIVQPAFVELAWKKLVPGGILHLATDWQAYAEHMVDIIEGLESDRFTNIAGSKRFSPRPQYRPMTKFEQRGERLGHSVWDLLYQKN